MIILCFFFLIVVYISILFFLAQVAQLVEQATENRCVGGSIPPWAPHEKSIHTNLYLTTIDNRLQIRLYLFSS